MVGQKLPNSWALLDIHGNVWEWCRDWYADKLPGGHDPDVRTKGSARVRRGGGWVDSAGFCRSAFRGWGTPDFRSSGVGLRVVRVLSK